MTDPIRIANCSGFYGDRVSAASEMVEDGPIDVLTGDWLAELTMLILSRSRAKRPGGGFARTFVTQMEQVMGTCLDTGIRVVSNAGGLDPAGCAEAVGEVADRLGLAPTIAVVTGDDVLDRLDDLQAAGHDLTHLDTGEPLDASRVEALTANVYLGCWGIADALSRGADIVITGRVTDAAVVVGPAAWHHAWSRADWDRLAGAVVAGHIIECGAQATGGNYSFFTEIPDMSHPGFPIAEIAADGSAVITKHPGTGGQVSLGTVTSQLLYEIGPPAYLTPDCTAHFETIELSDLGPDRVGVSTVRGSPPPPTAKVAINYVGGFRNEVTFCLTGLDIEAKAELVEAQFWSGVDGSRDGIAEVRTQLVRTDHPDPTTNEQATALLRIIAKDPDERIVGRAFSNAGTELVLASIPGMYLTSGPRPAQPYGVFWPALLPADLVQHRVDIGGEVTAVENWVEAPAAEPVVAAEPPTAEIPDGATTAVPLGRVVGARSGDKGGTANLGVFARSDEAFAWLDRYLDVERLRALMPHETDGLELVRHRLPNLRALNFVILGLLDEGVAASTRLDGQAKSLGEYLRAKVVEVPEALLDGE